MVPLGLNLTTMGAIGGNFISPEAAVIEDYMWEVATSGELRPLALGEVSDFHDTWDLVTITTAGHYQPQTVATVGDEGYWDILTISSGNDGIKPLDV